MTRAEFATPDSLETATSFLQQLEQAKQFVISHNTARSCQSVALRTIQQQNDLTQANPLPDDPVNSLIRLGSGLDQLVNISKSVEPWEILLDLGQFSSYNYQVLSMALQDFRSINERTMASTLLHLAIHHSGNDDL